MTRLTMLAAALGVSLAATAGAQEMPMPTPGPEHAVLKMDEGTWDAVVELTPPGAPAMTSKGVETNMMGCGGLCLIANFKGEFMPGVAFEGHGTTVYDAFAKKYVGSWTDSMSTGLSSSAGTYDAATRTVTAVMESRDMTGTMVKSRTVVQYPDADHRVMTMFTALPGGQEAQMMKISYTRRK